MPTSKKIKCLIVEDEPPAQEVLKKYIDQVNSLELCGTCNNAVEAISFLQSQPIDLIFLDIQMPGLLGTKFIRTINNPPRIIFTTAYRKFAVEGFELNAVDYLLKPISFERFLTGVNKVLQLNLQPAQGHHFSTADINPDSNHPFLYLRADRKMVKVLFDEILFIESLRDYLKVVTTAKTIITRQSISSLEDMLPKDSFIRIHRSFIVAINRIDAFFSDTVEIAGHQLPIGRLFKHEVSTRLNR